MNLNLLKKLKNKFNAQVNKNLQNKHRFSSIIKKKHNQQNLIICNFFFSNWSIISIFVSNRSLVDSRSSILVGNVTSPLKAISEI